jgi:hypothetical protein
MTGKTAGASFEVRDKVGYLSIRKLTKRYD